LNSPDTSPPPSADELIVRFDSAAPYTVGIEEELMLLDPDSFELVAMAEQVLDLVRGDPCFKPELPASQVEIVTPPTATVSEAVQMLYEARRRLAERTRGIVALGSAGVHPFSSGRGELNALPRYQQLIAEFGSAVERQLVCALQVHVAPGGADRALAIYNAARSYLPLVAALAANAPLYEARDSGLASVRPKLCELLPRQGVPPVLGSWSEYADALRWGARSGAVADPRTWWWELRLHPRFGTLEFRVPDAQVTAPDAGAIAAVVHGLVVELGERHDAGEPLAIAETWRIEENRWSACRHGVEGQMAELHGEGRRWTRDLLSELLEELRKRGTQLSSEAALARAYELLEQNGAMTQRQIANDAGPRAVAQWLAERFLVPLPGY
jgi:carboxylate-amine ligase